jgi:DNA invertase Pin-like site-specific DNA recombinase
MSTDRPELPDSLASLRVYGRERAAPTARAAALYARVSDARQESLPVQLERMRAYAAGLDLPIVCECQDEESGLITTRKAYQTVRQLARSGAISHVILFHSSRWGREDGEYITAARELERLGVELHATTLGKIDPGMVGFHALVSNMEVRNISSHVLPAMVARAQRGHDLGRPPLGYRRTLEPGVWEHDPAVAPVVQECLERYAAGASMRAVLHHLSTALGLRKTKAAVADMLGNPYYAGIRVYNRRRNSKIDGRYRKPRAEWVVTRHAHGLIDEETYQRIQERLATHQHTGRRAPESARFPLTGLVRCARCDAPMHGNRTAKTTHAPWFFYLCAVCGQSKSNTKVEGALQRALAAIPLDAGQIARSVGRARTRGKRPRDGTGVPPAALERRLGVLDERLGKLLTLHLDGAITPVEYTAARQQTLAERERLVAAQLHVVTPPAHAPAAPSDETRAAALHTAQQRLQALAAWLPLLAEMEPAERNRRYRSCVTHLALDCPTDTVTIHWQPWLATVRGLADETVRLPRGRGSRPITEQNATPSSGDLC